MKIYIALLTVLLILQTESHGDHDPQKINSFFKNCGKTETCSGLLRDKRSKLLECFRPPYISSPQAIPCVVAVKIAPPPKNATAKDSIYTVTLIFDIRVCGWSAAGIGFGNTMKEGFFFLECININKSTNLDFFSWAKDYQEPKRFDTESMKKMGFTMSIEDLVERNHAHCEFQIPSYFSLDTADGQKSFKLTGGKHSIALAYGQVRGLNRLSHHEDRAVNQAGPFDWSIVKKYVVPVSSTHNKGHGMLMVISYIFFVPVATIISRFFRETWVNSWVTRKFFKRRRLWFVLHAGLLTLAFVCVSGGSLWMWLGSKHIWPENSSSKSHATLGCISIAFFTAQLLAWIIPKSWTISKKLYGFLHLCLGMSCYIVGICNIAFVSHWIPGNMSCRAPLIVLLWAASHATVYLLFTSLLYIKDHEMRINNFRLRSFFAYPMRIKTVEEAPGFRGRIVLLFFFIILSLTATFGLCYDIYNSV